MSASSRVPQIAARRARLARGIKQGVAHAKEDGFLAASDHTLHQMAPMNLPRADASTAAAPVSPTVEIEHLLGTLYHARKALGELRREDSMQRIASSKACTDLLAFVSKTHDPMLLSAQERYSVTSAMLGSTDQACCVVA